MEQIRLSIDGTYLLYNCYTYLLYSCQLQFIIKVLVHCQILRHFHLGNNLAPANLHLLCLDLNFSSNKSNTITTNKPEVVSPSPFPKPPLSSQRFPRLPMSRTFEIFCLISEIQAYMRLKCFPFIFSYFFVKNFAFSKKFRKYFR